MYKIQFTNHMNLAVLPIVSRAQNKFFFKINKLEKKSYAILIFNSTNYNIVIEYVTNV